MKRFRFSLTSILKLRAHETKLAEEALAVARAARVLKETRLGEMRQHLAQLSSSFPSTAKAPHALQRYSAHIDDIRNACELAAKALDEARMHEARQLQLLIDRRREEESIKALHDQEAEAFRLDQLQLEGAQLDEQAIAGYHRKNMARNP